MTSVEDQMAMLEAAPEIFFGTSTRGRVNFAGKELLKASSPAKRKLARLTREKFMIRLLTVVCGITGGCKAVVSITLSPKYF